MAKVKEYIPIVGQSVIDDLRLIAEKLKGKVIQHVNSTAVGGGVAEILNCMIPLLQELGVDARWDVIKGGDQFFRVTKKFHNSLHGKEEEIHSKDFNIFLEASQKNIEKMNIYGDVVFIHDPQPIALIKKKNENKWIWRCHIDMSKPNERVWKFLRGFISKYDAAVFSAPSFSHKLPVRQFLISPSIDPLSDKNKELSKNVIKDVLTKYGITQNKPMITQISRFDVLKDPLGVIDAYWEVKKHIDCQLVLAGGGATDDPEGMKVYTEVKEKVKGHKDIHVLFYPFTDLEINALQRAATVIVQKSVKEGFGLTVTEALWKGKPVVASHVGGIPLQIKHKYSGLLCYSTEGATFAIKQLLSSPDYAKKLGENGRGHIKNNFLITRHIRDYMLLFLSFYYKQNVVYL